MLAAPADAVVKRYNRLLVAFYVAADALLARAFVLAYALRFETTLIPITKDVPPSTST